MNTERVRQVARQFPENGMKLLLQGPDNLRDLLGIARARQVGRTDFKRLRVDPTNYVSADFRHVQSDLVLTAPLRPAGKGRARRLTVTVLLEHQSEPDRLMILRLLDYLAQIWKAQARAWGEKHGSLASVQLSPILPVVLYTGTYRWERLGRLVDLMPEGEDFAEVTPELRPLFVNLPELPAARLRSGGAFGSVLRLIQQRRASETAFAKLLGEVVGDLEGLPAGKRLRWLELLCYVMALVYHERPKGEQQGLGELVLASVRTDSHR